MISYEEARAISDLISEEDNQKFWQIDPRVNYTDLEKKLCVTIPNYNNIAIIGTVIDSIRGEVGPNVAIYIFDNNSTDGSWEYLEELAQSNPSIYALRLPLNTGPNYSAQLILKSNVYKYTLFASGNDVILNRDIIGRMVSYMDANTDVNLVYGRNMRNDILAEPDEFTFSVPGRTRRRLLGLTDIDCFSQCTWLYTSSEPLWGIYRSSYAKLIPSINGYGLDHLIVSSVGYYGGITGIHTGLKQVGIETRNLKSLLASQNQRHFIVEQVSSTVSSSLPLDNSNFLSLMYTYFSGIQNKLIDDDSKDELVRESCVIIASRFFAIVLAELRQLRTEGIITDIQLSDIDYGRSFERECINQTLFIMKIVVPIIRSILRAN